MILIRRAHERARDSSIGRDARLTFAPAVNAPFDRFGSLELLRESRVDKRAGVREPRINSEIITYVHAGSLAFEDSTGITGMLHQGDFQRTTAGTGIQYSEVNVSTEQEAHVFQFTLTPDTLGLEPGHETRRFTLADRRGRLCVVASPNGTDGSLRIHQDALLYSAILATGQHLVHRLAHGRGAWLHVVEGSVSIGSTVLGTGDGIGFSLEESAAISVSESTEILLLDLGNFGFERPKGNGEKATLNPEVQKKSDNGSSLLGGPSSNCMTRSAA